MLLKILFLISLALKSFGVEFQLQNNDGGDVWIGIQGNNGHPHLSGGGLILKSGQLTSINAPDDWAGRFWPRTWCDPNSKHCDTGDCGNKLQCNGAGGRPPASLVEITLKGSSGLDYYDVSLVDGFNAKVAIEPKNGQGDGGQYSCKKSACQKNLNQNCPQKLQITNSHGVIACNSACNALGGDEYCCTGNHNTQQTCNSASWPVNYPKYFKDNCPDAYSYAFDDDKVHLLAKLKLI